jgi:hypothetical protein
MTTEITRWKPGNCVSSSIGISSHSSEAVEPSDPFWLLRAQRNIPQKILKKKGVQTVAGYRGVESIKSYNSEGLVTWYCMMAEQFEFGSRRQQGIFPFFK